MLSQEIKRIMKENDKYAKMLEEYLLTNLYLERFKPEDMRKAVTLYVRSGGKRLRPAILLWSCGALGGNVETALPAAAAVEIFHTWTLVHDDIIDRDLVVNPTKAGADLPDADQLSFASPAALNAWNDAQIASKPGWGYGGAPHLWDRRNRYRPFARRASFVPARITLRAPYALAVCTANRPMGPGPITAA